MATCSSEIRFDEISSFIPCSLCNIAGYIMLIKSEFVSIGVNRVANCLSWGADGRVAYGGHHSVVIYDPYNAKIVSTMLGHTGMVNCVLWLPEALKDPSAGVTLLASGSADQSIRIWAVRDTRSNTSLSKDLGTDAECPWVCIATLKGHSAPVTSLTVYPLPHLDSSETNLSTFTNSASAPTAGSFLLVSTAGDSDVHVWQYSPAVLTTGVLSSDLINPGDTRLGVEETSFLPSAASSDHVMADFAKAFSQDHWCLSQKLHVGNHIQQAAALTHLPSAPSWLILATGGTDKAVHLYIRPPGHDSQFSSVCKLQGHDNWVRSLAFCHAKVPGAKHGQEVVTGGAEESVELLLASASQDRYGRVWRIRDEDLEVSDSDPSYGSGASTLSGSLVASIARYAPKPRFSVADRKLVTGLEALLIGHEDWLHSICWNPKASTPLEASGNSRSCSSFDMPRDRSSLQLLTSSMDRTMMLWKHDPVSGIWMSETSVGDAGAQCLGYFGGCFSPDGRKILAHGFTGALHLWEGSSSNSAMDGLWAPRHALGGHFAAVAGCCWAMDGGCLLTVGEDQTARIFTSVLPDQAGEGALSSAPEAAVQGKQSVGRQGHWCEVARPQVHGHDFTCVASLSTANRSSAEGGKQVGGDKCSTSYLFISGSEEKILRAFEAPQAFMDTLDMARGLEPSSSRNPDHQQSNNDNNNHNRAFGAAIPALGLSNKAVYSSSGGDVEDLGSNAGISSGMPGGGYHEGPDFAPCAAPSVAKGPPLEEHLAQNTLWPEVHKLYGHGNDLYCLAASRDGRYAASACVAKSAAAAEIWIWAVNGWKGVSQVQAHTLTVTHLTWSHSDDFLASCSRDRSFCITRRIRSNSPDVEDTFQLVQRIKSAHSRVLWGISWAPDDSLIATGARDQTVKLWEVMTTAATAAGTATASPELTPTIAADGSMENVVADRAIATLPPFESSVNILSFAPSSLAAACCTSPHADVFHVKRTYVLGVGLESGDLQLWKLLRGQQIDASTPGHTSVALDSNTPPSQDALSGMIPRVPTSATSLLRDISLMWRCNAYYQHTAAVTGLSWKEATVSTSTAVEVQTTGLTKDMRREGGVGESLLGTAGDSGQIYWQMGTCGRDHAVRVFRITA
ncbi:hypothetical protein CEUSTIGMA_g2388.t1 [Chlamydomonas eustigma]|uniref:Elongator complex protein 2 n=1 Tax=Chlamydomonas eustigma TaxID=1157962 RepID=A0A250WWE1_9CHLO|nr:hypothetical protein CEUSTIGMA_g2388.t1 [Chlamydomonas eustigma]|eukprot:GAX74942.1 hypothetical protein CEUSTIGMA_g2388.t1 [Chlamydomonas eustigma]